MTQCKMVNNGLEVDHPQIAIIKCKSKNSRITHCKPKSLYLSKIVRYSQYCLIPVKIPHVQK